MKIYGFNTGGLSACGDTRFMTDKEVLAQLHIELKSAKQRLSKLDGDMLHLANLYNNYYDLTSAVGRCFIEMDSVNAIIADLNSKIKILKDIANANQI